MHESAQGPPDQGPPDQGTPDQGTSDQGTSGPGLVRADCGEQSSGSRCELHARPAIAKICRFADLQICRFADLQICSMGTGYLKKVRHSRAGALLSEKNTPPFLRRRKSTIPAHAGIHRPTTQRPKKHSVIPAKAEIHPIIRHSREGGNLQFPRMQEFIVPLPQRPKKTLRHSREGGNPQFPRMREFIVPLPQRPKKHSVIPAKAEIPHHPSSREGSVFSGVGVVGR